MLSYLSAFSIVAAILLILGISLVIFEMFIPGFGAPGISGIVLIAAGILIQAKSIEEALLLLLVVVAILGIALFIILCTAGKGRFPMKRLVLDDSIHPESSDLQFFVGKTGTALTPLRPAGTADFDGVRLDVMSEGSFIEANTPVRVLRTEGTHIIVRRID